MKVLLTSFAGVGASEGDGESSSARIGAGAGEGEGEGGGEGVAVRDAMAGVVSAVRAVGSHLTMTRLTYFCLPLPRFTAMNFLCANIREPQKLQCCSSRQSSQEDQTTKLCNCAIFMQFSITKAVKAF